VCLTVISADRLIEHGLTSPSTQYRLYGRRDHFSYWGKSQQMQHILLLTRKWSYV